jgi:dolichyl-phosphate-mannose-protein mannosyltransferase/tetratricopeptide repeat protein
MSPGSGLRRYSTAAGRLARSRRVQLTLIILVGAVLRLWGILHGLADGFIYHPDAPMAGFSAWHLYLGGSLRQARFGAAHGVLSWLAMEATDFAARGLGYPPQWNFALIGSVLAVLTAVLGILTIPAVYQLGARAFGRRAGLLAAALLAVSPLHTFHSHYPYRDVPMVLALTLTLAACVQLAARPSAIVYAAAAAGAGLTIVLKPGGLVVTAPLAMALLLVWRRRRARWVLVGAATVLVAVLAGTSLFQTGHSISPLAGARDRLHFVWTFVLRHGPTVGDGTVRAAHLLRDWVGWPALVVSSLGLGAALRRRRLADLVLVAFIVPAFFAAAAIPWMDERFFVYLVPPAAVLTARLLVGAWDRARSRRLARVAVVVVTLTLLIGDLGRSAWHDVLLSLPDTRAVAGRWFEAHVPRTTRVAMEGYFPLGVNEWPRATFFEPRWPLATVLAGADVLVTSSLEHGRYLDPGRPSPAAPRAFFKALPNTAPLMRTFALSPVGFADPDIAVYATRPPRVVGAPVLLWPRPHDHTWNGNLALLDSGPYDRDDRTVLLGGAQSYDVVLASRSPVDDVLVFVANGSDRSLIRVTVGWARRKEALAPGESRVLHFRPRWWWPARPALYRVKVGFLPEGRSALIQVRAGAREIGAAYASWGRWDAAVPYLERAVAASPGDGEMLLLLGTAYRHVGRAEDARRVGTRLAADAPAYVASVRQLGRDQEVPASWTPAFERATGLDAELLTTALTQEIRIDGILTGGRLGGGDPARPGEVAAVFEREIDRPGVILNGPRSPRPLLYLEPGAYRARFALRGGAGSAGQPSIVLRVFAERRLLAARPVTAEDLGGGQRAVDIEVPFEHESPATPIAVQVEATGRGSFVVDHVRIGPDLPGFFRQRSRALEALGG